MDANVLNENLIKKKHLTQSKLDDSHKIQIESVDSSLKDDHINTDTVTSNQNPQSYKEKRSKKIENEQKSLSNKNKKNAKVNFFFHNSKIL